MFFIHRLVFCFQKGASCIQDSVLCEAASFLYIIIKKPCSLALLKGDCCWQDLCAVMEKEASATSDFLDVVYLQTLLVAMNASCLIDALMGRAMLCEGCPFL